MEQHEFNPEAHEDFVSRRSQEHRRAIARVALFDELIDMHHDGMCSFDEALSQFHHDADVAGIGFDTATQPQPSNP